MKLIDTINKEFKLNIMLNDVVIKAASLACRDVPEINATWNEKAIRQYLDVNVNFIVNT